MSFNLSSLFDVYGSNPRANRYLQNLSNDAMDAYLTRVDPNYVSDGSSAVQAQAVADWEREKAIRNNQIANTAERNQIQQDRAIENAYRASVPQSRPLNANDPYSLIDRNTGRIIPMADAQAGGITPAQYYLATEMLKRRGYKGF